MVCPVLRASGNIFALERYTKTLVGVYYAHMICWRLRSAHYTQENTVCVCKSEQYKPIKCMRLKYITRGYMPRTKVCALNAYARPHVLMRIHRKFMIKKRENTFHFYKSADSRVHCKILIISWSCVTIIQWWYRVFAKRWVPPDFNEYTCTWHCTVYTCTYIHRHVWLVLGISTSWLTIPIMHLFYVTTCTFCTYA